jgi:hypothetical protein
MTVRPGRSHCHYYVRHRETDWRYTAPATVRSLQDWT